MTQHVRVHLGYLLGLCSAMLAVLVRPQLQDHVGIRWVVGFALAGLSLGALKYLAGSFDGTGRDGAGPKRPPGQRLGHP